tara:strand:- start:100 stop:627 length:528 start_codon:yes stop_codon:yes gene_type:complete
MRGGSKFKGQSDTAGTILNNYHENTEKQRDVQNDLNNQFGGKKGMRGGGGDQYASIVAGGDKQVVGSQLNIQNSLEQAKYDDSLSHCSDGSCNKSGGRKRRRTRRKSKKVKKSESDKMTKKGRKTKKVRKKKRKLNKYFAMMLDAKKKGLASFKYNGKTYVGKKHNRLGMIYKKK